METLSDQTETVLTNNQINRSIIVLSFLQWQSSNAIKTATLTLAHLIVVKRIVDGDVAFPSYGHRHEDGSGDRHLVERVEEVREEDDMQLRGHVEVLPVKSDKERDGNCNYVRAYATMTETLKFPIGKVKWINKAVSRPQKTSHTTDRPDALEDGTEQVRWVEAREAHEEKVERIPHLFTRYDDGGNRVAHDPQDGERRLQEGSVEDPSPTILCGCGGIKWSWLVGKLLSHLQFLTSLSWRALRTCISMRKNAPKSDAIFWGMYTVHWIPTKSHSQFCVG